MLTPVVLRLSDDLLSSADVGSSQDLTEVFISFETRKVCNVEVIGLERLSDSSES